MFDQICVPLQPFFKKQTASTCCASTCCAVAESQKFFCRDAAQLLSRMVFPWHMYANVYLFLWVLGVKYLRNETYNGAEKSLTALPHHKRQLQFFPTTGC